MEPMVSTSMEAGEKTVEAEDKKVLLFGITGGGKSTIANVLVAGGLQPVIFAYSDAASRCTSAIQKKSGRGWIVKDTVGLGEATNVGAVSNTEAKNKLVDFLKEVKDEYSHIIYVQKASRITTMEEPIWKLFAKIFEGAEDAFVIVITGAETGWLEEHRDRFPEYWKNHNVLATNIPPIHKRPTIERRLKVIREQSIAQLERDLNRLFLDRGNNYSTPEIAKMSAEQLEAKSWTLLGYVISLIRRFFNKDLWQSVASRLTTVVDVRGHLLYVATQFQGQLINDQGVLKIDLGRVAETAPHLSRTLVVEDFIRQVNEGGGDGYFVSSQWLLSLVEDERDSLLSCLRTAGYSETCQTTTTILFRRTENHTPRIFTKVFVCPEDIGEVPAPKWVDDLLGIAGEGLTAEKNVAIADVVSSNNRVEASSSIHHGRNLVNTLPAERQAAELKLFKETIKSESHQSFCVSKTWLSDLDGDSKEMLLTLFREAGYEKISQSNSATWYERIQDCVGNQASGACDTDTKSSTNRNDAGSGQVKQMTTSKLFQFFCLPRIADREDDASGSSPVTVTTETKKIQDSGSTCHAQILRVECCKTSHCRTPGEQTRSEDFYRQDFDDSVGKWPISKSEEVATTIEKSFKIPTLVFLTDQGAMKVLMNLKALATISFSCCLKMGPQPPQIRIKFSIISAEIKNKEAQVEFGNSLVLSYLCTNVYSCIQNINSGSQSKWIPLHLEDEYNPPRGRVSGKDPHLWLEKSGITPEDRDPGSTSLLLRGDVNKRRRHDSGPPHPLHFQERTRPVIFEGDITANLPREVDLGSFFKIHLRHKLEVSYFRPSEPILEQGHAWIANDGAEEIEFSCYLKISSENILVG